MNLIVKHIVILGENKIIIVPKSNYLGLKDKEIVNIVLEKENLLDTDVSWFLFDDKPNIVEYEQL